MPIHAVLFDLDDTLFDHQTSARKGLNGFLRQLGTAPSRQLERRWFDIEEQHFNRFLLKELSFHEQRRERLRQFLPYTNTAAPLAETELDALFEAYLHSYEKAWTAFPDARPILEGLTAAGVGVGVITNGHHEQQLSKIKSIGLEPFLSNVYSPDTTGSAKPDPQSFLQPCKSMDVLPGEALYVGDNYVVDVRGAREAGLQAVHLDRQRAGTLGSIQTLADLLRLVVA